MRRMTWVANLFCTCTSVDKTPKRNNKVISTTMALFALVREILKLHQIIGVTKQQCLNLAVISSVVSIGKNRFSELQLCQRGLDSISRILFKYFSVKMFEPKFWQCETVPMIQFTMWNHFMIVLEFMEQRPCPQQT